MKISLDSFALGKWWHYSRAQRRESIAPIPETWIPKNTAGRTSILAQFLLAVTLHSNHTSSTHFKYGLSVSRNTHTCTSYHCLLKRNIRRVISYSHLIPTPGPPCTKLCHRHLPLTWVTKVYLWNILSNVLIACSITQYSIRSFLSDNEVKVLYGIHQHESCWHHLSHGLQVGLPLIRDHRSALCNIACWTILSVDTIVAVFMDCAS